jgi:hypothetical protein
VRQPARPTGLGVTHEKEDPMGRTSFVTWLFVMSAACVLIAVGDRSWGWLVGAIVFASVAMFARRQLVAEHEEGQAGPRLGFVGIAIVVMMVVMYFLLRLQTSA